MTTIVFSSQTIVSSEGSITSNLSGPILPSQAFMLSEGSLTAQQTFYSSKPGIQLWIDPSDCYEELQ